MVNRDKNTEDHAIKDHQKNRRHRGQHPRSHGQHGHREIVLKQERRHEELHAAGILSSMSQMTDELLGGSSRLTWITARPKCVAEYGVSHRSKVANERT